MSIGLQQLWAKTDPFQSILTHSFISGIVAQVIVHKMIVPGVRNKLLASMQELRIISIFASTGAR